jgi:hypothetical protein
VTQSQIPEWRELTDADYERMQREDTLRFMNGYVVNPSRKALIRMVRKSVYEELRGLHIDGNLYWWDAHLATHGQAIRYLGFLERFHTDWMKHRRQWGVEMHIDRNDKASIFMTCASDDGLASAMAHPTLKDGFDDHGNLLED